MDGKINVPGEIALLAGIALTSLGVILMVKADFGISTVMSLPFSLSCMFTEISFGSWNLIYQASLLVLLVVITRRFKIGYVVSVLLAAGFGLTLDLFRSVMGDLPGDLPFRFLYLVASYPIICLAISLMIGSKVPLMVADAFIYDLTTHFQVTYRRMKTMFDVSCVAISVGATLAALGYIAGVGLGTVVMALLTGAGVHAMNGVLRRTVEIKPWSKRLERMAK